MIMEDKEVREVDGFEGAAVSVEVADSLDDGNCVRLVCNPHQPPYETAWLSPAAARSLARWLLEKADEAELRNLEAEDVPMVCTSCHKPVRRTFGSMRWQHCEPADLLACDVRGLIRAKVATGA